MSTWPGLDDAASPAAAGIRSFDHCETWLLHFAFLEKSFNITNVALGPKTVWLARREAEVLGTRDIRASGPMQALRLQSHLRNS